MRGHNLISGILIAVNFMGYHLGLLDIDCS